jgi:hypothetical protein
MGRQKCHIQSLLLKSLHLALLQRNLNRVSLGWHLLKNQIQTKHSIFFKRMLKWEVQQKDLNRVKIVKHESQLKGGYAHQKL